MFKIYDIWGKIGDKYFSWLRKLLRVKPRRRIRIGNYTSPDFDIIFRSRSDFVKILLRIIATKTNFENDYIDYEIVVDEAHKYFSNRAWKDFPPEVTDFLSEVRKQDTTVHCLSPRFLLMDTNIRRMSYTVREFKKWFFFRFVQTYKLIREDSSVLQDETVAEKLGIVPLIPIWVVSYFLRLYTQYTRRYDTKEIVFTHISIYDRYSAEYLTLYFLYRSILRIPRRLLSS